MMQDERHQQQLQLLHIGQDIQQKQLQASEAERQLRAVRQRAQAVRQHVQHRQVRLREAQQHLAHLSRQVQATLPQQRDQLAQSCIRTLDTLAREQRNK